MTGGDGRELLTDRRVDEAYLVYKPLAANTFGHLITSGTNMEGRLLFSKQILQGIGYLHSIGVMHRDIKPTNLMIVSYHPPRAIVTDFGHAIFGNTSRDHYKGTLCYLAPEVWDLKHNKPDVPAYDNKVDIWAYAVSTYQLLCYRPWWWGDEITLDCSNEAETHLARMNNEHLTPEVKTILRLMLSRNPRIRISAADALETEALRRIISVDNRGSGDDPGAEGRGHKRIQT